MKDKIPLRSPGITLFLLKGVIQFRIVHELALFLLISHVKLLGNTEWFSLVSKVGRWDTIHKNITMEN